MPALPPPKPGRVLAYYVNKEYRPENELELQLDEGELIFVEEGTGEFLNVACGQRTGKLASKCVTSDDDEYRIVSAVEYPMHEAAKRGDLEFVRECLKNKISVNSLDTSSSTPLYWASLNGHLDIVIELLKNPSIDISSKNKLGDTPLHAASRKGRIDCVKALIEHGANVFIINKDNQKPIHLAQTPEVASIIKLTMDTVPESDEQNEYESSEDEQ